jgi:hypothetical protein
MQWGTLPEYLRQWLEDFLFGNKKSEGEIKMADETTTTETAETTTTETTTDTTTSVVSDALTELASLISSIADSAATSAISDIIADWTAEIGTTSSLWVKARNAFYIAGLTLISTTLVSLLKSKLSDEISALVDKLDD